MGKLINIGEFDTYVMVLSYTTTRGENGAVIPGTQLVLRFLAKVETKNLEEKAGEDYIVLSDVVEITSYYMQSLNNACRLAINGVYYDIISVTKVGKLFMKVIAKRMLRDGRN